jgi:hypothetical protein
LISRKKGEDHNLHLDHRRILFQAITLSMMMTMILDLSLLTSQLRRSLHLNLQVLIFVTLSIRYNVLHRLGVQQMAHQV